MNGDGRILKGYTIRNRRIPYETWKKFHKQQKALRRSVAEDWRMAGWQE
jgi:hypothetical protein